MSKSLSLEGLSWMGVKRPVLSVDESTLIPDGVWLCIDDDIDQMRGEDIHLTRADVIDLIHTLEALI